MLANGSNLEALTCSTISLMMCSFALFVASLPYILCARCCGRKRLGSLVNMVCSIYCLNVAVINYRPQRSWGKVMFSQACVILFTGECLPQCMLGYNPQEQTSPQSRHIPRARHPPGADPPLEQTPQSRHPPEHTPLQEQTSPQEQTPPKSRHPPGTRHTPQSRHPSCRACWEIRSTHGRYTSYWNAILLRLSLFKWLRRLARLSHSVLHIRMWVLVPPRCRIVSRYLSKLIS